MKITTVSLSDLHASRRWDPAFHLLQSEHRGRMTQLETIYTLEQARSELESLPAELLKALQPLKTGEVYSLGSKDLLKMGLKHPYLALALVEAAMPQHIHQARETQDAAGKQADRLEQLKVRWATQTAAPDTTTSKTPEVVPNDLQNTPAGPLTPPSRTARPR